MPAGDSKAPLSGASNGQKKGEVEMADLTKKGPADQATVTTPAHEGIEDLGVGLLSMALDHVLVMGVLFVIMAIIVRALFLLLRVALKTRVTVAFLDFFSIMLLFGMTGWVGFIARQTISGLIGVQPSWKPDHLHSWIVMSISFGCLVVLCGLYKLLLGGSYITTLIVLGVMFQIGFWLYDLVSYVRTQVREKVIVTPEHYGELRVGCPSFLLLLLLILWVCGGVHRNTVLGHHYVPKEDDDMHGIWEMVDGKDHAGYWSFELHPGPEPASQFQDLSHALGEEVIRTFIATPVGYHKADLECGKSNGHPGYLILLHDNGVLGFVGKILDSEKYEHGTTKLSKPSMDELVCFARSEDKRLTVTNVLHGALHGCFCFGLFLDAQTMQRRNRWAWDTGRGWKAVRKKDDGRRLRIHNESATEF